jgi:hypothetical protein
MQPPTCYINDRMSHDEQLEGKQLRHRAKLSEITPPLRSCSKEAPKMYQNAMTKVTGEVGKNIKGKSVTTTNGRHKHAHR